MRNIAQELNVVANLKAASAHLQAAAELMLLDEHTDELDMAEGADEQIALAINKLIACDYDMTALLEYAATVA